MASILKSSFLASASSRAHICHSKNNRSFLTTFPTKMAQKLTPEQRNASLKTLLDKGWAETEGRDAIKKTFNFKDFNEAFGFMSRVACLAEKVEHHPEWFNVYNKVEVVLSTHDVKGLSSKDIEMANFMDSITA